MKVFFVDDDIYINKFHDITLTPLAQAQGKEVLFFSNGKAALETLGQSDALDWPELIFLDVNMPQMDAWEFLEAYGKLEHAKQNVIILTTVAELIEDDVSDQYPQILSIDNKPLAKDNFVRFLEDSPIGDQT